jgi:two-component system sensor histidine kinase YesM
MVEWEYDKTMEDYKIIKIVLQPFVENSIYHGIRENESTSTIRIQLQQENQNLFITISDDGSGIPPAKLRELKNQLSAAEYNPDHIGVVNTHKRISLAFGEEYGITEIKSEPGKGTSIKLKLPVVAEEEDRIR